MCLPRSYKFGRQACPQLRSQSAELLESAASVLLETKLFVPRRRRQVVLRGRLSERLNQALEAKLTLVSAPPGFGKTTLVAEWLAEAHVEAAWLSLDQGDNNSSFWSYLVAALQTVQSGIGETTAALLQSPQPPPIESLLGTLLNELNALPRDLVLVLDDYHVIDDARHPRWHGLPARPPATEAPPGRRQPRRSATAASPYARARRAGRDSCRRPALYVRRGDGLLQRRDGAAS